MDYQEDKVDEVILALLYLTAHGEPGSVKRAWKGHDWDALNRLHEKGYIDNPKSKAKSVSLTEEGWQKSEELFRKYFSGQ